MSTEETVSRKERKTQRDAERRTKGKKRKISEVVDENEAVAPIIVSEGMDAPSAAAEAKPKKRKHTAETGTKARATTAKPEKRKRTAEDAAQTPASDAAGQAASAETTARPKKRRKAAKPASTAAAADGAEATDEPTAPATKSRFIVFLGNLPYTTTDASLRTHFAKLAPFTLRHRTDPKTKKSKGFAFVEFENYDRMKTCLKLYHHSLFDPQAEENGGKGKGNGRGGRKINVELTSGGGGNTGARKEKIREKNGRLEEQRKRRAEAEREEKEKKEGGEGGKRKGEGAAAAAAASEEGEMGIHPSRLARLQQT